MNRAYVETTILTNVLLKPDSKKQAAARSALSRYEETLLGYFGRSIGSSCYARPGRGRFAPQGSIPRRRVSRPLSISSGQPHQAQLAEAAESYHRDDSRPGVLHGG